MKLGKSISLFFGLSIISFGGGILLGFHLENHFYSDEMTKEIYTESQTDIDLSK